MLSVWTRFKFLSFGKELSLWQTFGKGEIAGNRHFLPFPHFFLIYYREKSSFLQCHLQILLIVSQLKYFCLIRSHFYGYENDLVI